MYHLDPKKLLKSVSGDLANAAIVRWCLDYMFSVSQSHLTALSEIKKAWPFDSQKLATEAFTATPEYVSVIMGDDGGDMLFSRLLKRHFEQERIMRMLSNSDVCEQTSVSKKLRESEFGQEVEVFKDSKNIALGDYAGIFPTRSYDVNKEVFLVTGVFYSYLTEKYPTVDIELKLKEAHGYFVSNPLSRRHSAGYKNYLEGWVSGDLIRLHKIRKSKAQIDKNLFYTDFLNDQ